MIDFQPGQKLHCKTIQDGKVLPETCCVEVLQVRRNHVTHEPVSVRVRSGPRVLWVQPQYLSVEAPDPTVVALFHAERARERRQENARKRREMCEGY